MSDLFPAGTKIPQHLAIIPDGNRRWAKLHGLPTIKGHQKGFQVLLKIAKAARSWGVHTISLWLFSTENWQRDKSEVDYLMKIEEAMLKKHLPEAKKEGVRIIHLGRKDRIPASFARALKDAEDQTRKNTDHVLNIAVDYGGRDEIVRAIKKYQISNIKHQTMTERVKGTPPRWPEGTPRMVKELTSEEVDGPTEELFSQFLDTADQPYPYPDLLIRTSGEMRISGFFPWQTSYTEFYFLKKHLPDCTVDDLKEAILEYNRRERRFGK